MVQLLGTRVKAEQTRQRNKEKEEAAQKDAQLRDELKASKLKVKELQGKIEEASKTTMLELTKSAEALLEKKREWCLVGCTEYQKDKCRVCESTKILESTNTLSGIEGVMLLGTALRTVNSVVASTDTWSKAIGTLAAMAEGGGK